MKPVGPKLAGIMSKLSVGVKSNDADSGLIPSM